MRITGCLVLAGVAWGVLAGQPLAQQPPGFTPQQLDQMSKERMQAQGPRNWGQPPPESSVPTETVLPLDGLWVCMSAKQWQPIYASPSVASEMIGETLSQVAVGGKTVAGFDPILMRAGRIGYVEAGIVSPYHSTLRPGSTCTVQGVRPGGMVVFGYN